MSENESGNKLYRSREEIARRLAEVEKAPCGRSQRQLAEELEIPRATLQHWLKRKESIDAAPEVVAFFESPAGVAFLHRLVVGSHYVMTLVGPCSIRQVCLLLELTGLNQFVAASYSPHQKVAVAMEKAINEFDQEEKKRLAGEMVSKQITVCEDETFHPEICLVAIEPVSNFIILEKYAANRKAETWTASLEQATESLPVEIVQSTSDEGKGILHHVKEDLGVHHSPDLFHPQHDLVKGTSFALASRKRKAEKAVRETGEAVSQQQAEKEAYCSGKRSPGRPPDFDKRIAQAQKKVDEAIETLKTAEAHQEQAKKAIQDISTAYHPYDLETGAARSAEEVASAVEECFAEIEEVAFDAKLPDYSLKKVKKAKRVVVNMVATIAFFFLTITAKIEALSLPPDVEQAVYDNLIPGIYLHLVSQKAKNAQERHELQSKSEQLLTPLRARDGPLSVLDEEDKLLIEQVAKQCAQLFQRSSSCVEGRNGQLALRHHSLHRISDRKLGALTAVHNYFIERKDSTTAAERFFGTKPRNLFEWLLKRVDLPGRPAKKRSQPKRKEYLALVAA